jgi:hypothetical protein
MIEDMRIPSASLEIIKETRLNQGQSVRDWSSSEVFCEFIRALSAARRWALVFYSCSCRHQETTRLLKITVYKSEYYKSENKIFLAAHRLVQLF